MFYWSLWTRSQTFTALVSKWCWQVLLADPQSGGEQPGNSAPKFSETCSVEYISWVRSCLLSKWSHNWWFRWKLWQSNVFSLQIMAMLTWNEMPCVENLQITYCVHCRNTNTLGYRCQRSVFCDCYRNMGHFLCSVERIKSFVNVHLHCIFSNVPLGPPELLRSEISFLRTGNIPKQWKSTQARSYLNEMCILFVFW